MKETKYKKFPPLSTIRRESLITVMFIHSIATEVRLLPQMFMNDSLIEKLFKERQTVIFGHASGKENIFSSNQTERQTSVQTGRRRRKGASRKRTTKTIKLSSKITCLITS